jgi:hypothetical protein
LAVKNIHKTYIIMEIEQAIRIAIGVLFIIASVFGYAYYEVSKKTKK